MRPVKLGEVLTAGTRLTLFSADKPDRFFRVITFWIDKLSGVALDLETGVPSYQIEDEEGRIHLRPDQAGFDSRQIFDGALVEDREAGVME